MEKQSKENLLFLTLKELLSYTTHIHIGTNTGERDYEEHHPRHEKEERLNAIILLPKVKADLREKADLLRESWIVTKMIWN